MGEKADSWDLGRRKVQTGGASSIANMAHAVHAVVDFAVLQSPFTNPDASVAQ
jgi:hypothetical protein